MMSRLKVALGTVPKDSGTFSFYRNLRSSLDSERFDVRCVSVGSQESAKIIESFADDGCVALAPDVSNRKRQAEVFVDWCERTSVDIVVPLNSVAMLSSLAHLPSRVRVVSRCANSFVHGYRITVMCRKRLSRIVVTTPRQEDDLVETYHVEKEELSLIPNGVDVDRFERVMPKNGDQGPEIRLGFLGRLEHHQKGVLFIPEVLQELEKTRVPFRVVIGGHGVHERRLRHDLRDLVDKGRVEFAGAIDREDVPAFLKAVDVLLFPSQFEGCPNVLLEAMAAGCVPVAWRLKGITDWIIEEGRSGLLAEKGDVEAFARCIGTLAVDRGILRTLSRNAVHAMRERFSLGSMVNAYGDLFTTVMDKPHVRWVPKPFIEFRLHPDFRGSTLGRLVPGWIKNSLRRLVYGFGWSKRYE